MPDSPSNLPGKGLFGWLGRQIGHVHKAVTTKPAADEPSPARSTSPSPSAPKVIYRDGTVEEAPHPTQPGVKLRRTIIDEVVMDDAPLKPPGATSRD